MNDSLGEITALLHRVEYDRSAAERLYELVASELRCIAEHQMAKERIDHTLQATILIDDAFVHVALKGIPFQNRRHFYLAAAKAMRNILVGYQRRRMTQKRGGNWQRVPVELDSLPTDAGGASVVDLVMLDEALTGLEEFDPVATRVVELLYFGGYQQKEVAEMLDVDRRTVGRKFELARAYLFEQLGDGEKV